MTRQLLLIESDSLMADAVRRAFGPAGFSVATLTAGEDAVDQCKTNPPDLILLSAELPDMSGFSVCNRIKRAVADVPLILYTGEANTSAIEAHRATRTHADDYLQKPLDMADLVGRAAHLLEGAPPRPQAVSSSGTGRPRGDEAGAAGEARGNLQAGLTAAELTDPFADWPRDPPAPKGTPEEKLEFFRGRLKVKDAFLARLREIFTSLRAESSVLREEMVQWGERRQALEAQLTEALSAAEEQKSLANVLEQRLGEAESTRQSISDVLNESIQAQEASEQQWSLRMATSEEERAKLEAELKQVRAEQDQLMDARAAEWASEREELSQQIGELRAERDDLEIQGKQLAAQMEHQATMNQEALNQVSQDVEAAHAALDEANGRAQVIAGELAEAQAMIEALQAEVESQKAARAAIDEQGRQARAEATAYNEKAIAAEQAYHARTAELEAARRRIQEMATALDEGKASVEGVKGEVARLQEELEAGTRKIAQLTSDRNQLGQQVEVERKVAAQAKAAAERHQAEVTRLSKLEPVAEEAVRLKREFANLQEAMRQRTQQTESASRSAHEAAAERERLKEKHEIEVSHLNGEVSRRDSEISALKRRLSDLETGQAARGADTQKISTELDALRRSRAEETAELERRHAAEVARIKAAMVDLEKHLEGRVRTETQLKKRVVELERSTAGRQIVPAAPEEMAKLQAEIKKVSDEIEELREENEFLNTEVARYHTKNKELQGQLASMRES